jgi:GNAT superfamily N-acetyltransferase
MENFRIRSATLADAAELLRIRYDAIMRVRIAGVAQELVRRWAERRDIRWMVHAIPERETWAATVDDRIVSWIAIKNDHVDGLYTDPHHSTRGIGSALLQFAEAVLEDRGIEFIRLEASPNAESFYRRRGYEPVGPRSTDSAQPMRKAVTPTGGGA